MMVKTSAEMIEQRRDHDGDAPEDVAAASSGLLASQKRVGHVDAEIAGGIEAEERRPQARCCSVAPSGVWAAARALTMPIEKTWSE